MRNSKKGNQRDIFEYEFYNAKNALFFSSAGYETPEQAINAANDDYANFKTRGFSYARFRRITLHEVRGSWEQFSKVDVFPVFPPFVQ